MKPEADKLRQRAAEWMKQQAEALKDVDPEMPESLNDRQQDQCEVLCAIADLVGDAWPKKVRAALKASRLTPKTLRSACGCWQILLLFSGDVLPQG